MFSQHDQLSGPKSHAKGAPSADHEWTALRHTIVSYVMRRGQPRHIAEDVAQDACIKLLRYCEQQRPASLYALAFRIASNCLVDMVRKEGTGHAELADDLACEAPLQDRIIDGQLRVIRFETALAAMPSLRRAVFRKRRIDNHSHAQIAAEFGISVASVEKHVSRGLQDLRRALQIDKDGDIR
ncbi:MAG: RNA polymerase sigma factor [Alphaproteobacteria bacterium]|nr:RNA polymerase sigma factor [Alphaproteobacteria bacterium]